jgi:hypothetical protein
MQTKIHVCVRDFDVSALDLISCSEPPSAKPAGNTQEKPELG